MVEPTIVRTNGWRSTHFQDITGRTARVPGRFFSQYRYRRAFENMSRSHPRCLRRTQHSGEIRARSRRLGSRLDDVEYRPGSAVLTGTDNFKIDARARPIFKQKMAQRVGIHTERPFINPCRRAESYFCYRVLGQSQLHVIRFKSGSYG